MFYGIKPDYIDHSFDCAARTMHGWNYSRSQTGGWIYSCTQTGEWIYNQPRTTQRRIGGISYGHGQHDTTTTHGLKTETTKAVVVFDKLISFIASTITFSRNHIRKPQTPSIFSNPYYILI